MNNKSQLSATTGVNIDLNTKLNLYSRNTVNYNNLSFFNKYIDKKLIANTKTKYTNSEEINYANNIEKHCQFLLNKWNELKDKESSGSL